MTIASIPIKEQLLYKIKRKKKGDLKSFNSYKGTIVIEKMKMKNLNLFKLQFL